MLRKFFPRMFFSWWYLRRAPWDTGISPPELLTFISSRPPGRALDLGCGTGTNVITLAEHGWQALGVDFAPRAIALARRKARAAGVDGRAAFLAADVTRLPEVSGPFDLILDIGCFHGLDLAGKRSYQESLVWLLAPGGKLLLYGFLGNATGGPGITEDDVAALANLLSLEQRVEGYDRSRPSVWLTFCKS